MATIIKCPHCENEFPLEDALSEELKDSIEKEKHLLREQMREYKKNAEERLKVKDDEINKIKLQQDEITRNKINEALTKKETELKESITKNISSDFESQIKLLQQTNNDYEEKLKLSRQKELEFLQKEKNLQTKEEELQITLHKQLLTEREKLKEQLVKEEAERLSLKEQEHNLQIRDLQKQLDDQKKLTEEMRRKQEQGSMQLQGEVQELLLEEILKESFPSDVVNEVQKGKKGADCLLLVKNKFGHDCGTILFESKRTVAWKNEWIEKLKQDKINCNADVAIIVSQVLPERMENNFGFEDGIWICSFEDVKILTASLREGIINVYQEIKKHDNQGDKMQLLYEYMTSPEFASQWKAIRGVFRNMKQLIEDEKRAMEKIWKNREKQLDAALHNSGLIMGSIEGIAGKNSIDLNLIADNDLLLLD